MDNHMKRKRKKRRKKKERKSTKDLSLFSLTNELIESDRKDNADFGFER